MGGNDGKVHKELAYHIPPGLIEYISGLCTLNDCQRPRIPVKMLVDGTGVPKNKQKGANARCATS